MLKELTIRVVAAVIAILIIMCIVAYFEMVQRQRMAAAASAQQTPGKKSGCGCSGCGGHSVVTNSFNDFMPAGGGSPGFGIIRQ